MYRPDIFCQISPKSNSQVYLHKVQKIIKRTSLKNYIGRYMNIKDLITIIKCILVHRKLYLLKLIIKWTINIRKNI